MSVIDTFFFQFKSDASDLKTGLKDAEESSKKLGDNLNKTDEIASKLGQNFKDLAKSAGMVLAAAFSGDQLKKLVQETSEHTFAIRQQASALGMSVEKLSAWQQAVELSGGTAAGATQTLTGLHDKLVEMARFGGAMGPDVIGLQKLGLSVKDLHDGIKDPTLVLGKLADTFHSLNKAGQLSLGKNLGLDLGTIMLLSQGKRGLEEFLAKQKELGVVTEKQAELSAKFMLKLKELGISLESSAREIVTKMLPALTWFADKVEAVVTFLTSHKALAEGFFAGVATVITIAYLPAIIEAAVATLAVIGPFVLMAAGAIAVGAAIGLVVDDIYNFIEGGKSLIGDAVNKWPIIGEVFRAIKEIILMCVEGIKQAFHALVDKMAWMKPIWNEALDAMTKPWKWLEESIQRVWDLIKNAPIEGINWIGKKLAQLTGGHFDEIGSGVDAPAAAGAVKKLATGPRLSGVPEDVRQAAIKSEAKYGIPAEVTIAQWQLESGGGAHMPAGSNNPFGIKARAGQPFVEAMTTENVGGVDQRVMQKFAKFDSLEDAFDAHAKLLSEGKAYNEARKHEDDPKAFADALTGHYATDPDYGSKLKRIMNSNGSSAMMAAPGSFAGDNSTSPMLPAPWSFTSDNSTSAMTVNTGPITVNTQATDGEEVSKAIGTSLDKHIKNAMDHFDNGVGA
jgi:hypothetical protein